MRASLLFLHGIGGNRRHWDAARVLRLGDRAAAWDARGGESDDYEGPLEFSRSRPIWCACSISAPAGRAWWASPWAGASRATSRSGTRSACARSRWRTYEPRVRRATPGPVKAFLDARRAPLLAGKTPAELAPSSPASSPGRASHAALDALVDSISRLHKESYLKTLEASVTQDRAAPLERLCVPTLVVTSEHDSLYPPALARAMAARIPGAELVEIPGAGHLRTSSSPSTSMQRCRLSFRNYDPESLSSFCSERMRHAIFWSGKRRGNSV